ncbi:MAG: MerR family transcriptional regulator [Lachnospiraceae bacterium]|nr:MerR family transcriptional regulator [Lachnospiraceae bacterium]
MEKRYSISDAARQVNVEAHVLRYWEEELGLVIPRNGQGHRFYRERDIHMLHKIKEWKEQGFQLRAIKLLLPDMEQIELMSAQELYALREELNQKVQMDEEKTRRIGRMGQVMTMPNVRNNGGRQLADTRTQEEKLKQFEMMMRNMITSVVKETQEASEQRITEAISEKVTKEMDYLMREKEELQEKQIEILQQILAELRPAQKEVAASEEPQIRAVHSKRPEKVLQRGKKWLRLPF